MRAQTEDSDFAANIRPMIVARRSVWASTLGGGGGGGGGPHHGDDDAAFFAAAGRRRGPGGGGDEEGGGLFAQDADVRPVQNEGTASAFFFGLVLGWSLGVLMLIFAIGPSSSRRFKMGLLAGVALNFLAAVVLTVMSDDAAAADAGGGGTGAGGTGSGGGGGGPIDQGAWAGANTGPTPVDLNALGRLR